MVYRRAAENAEAIQREYLIIAVNEQITFIKKSSALPQCSLRLCGKPNRAKTKAREWNGLDGDNLRRLKLRGV